MEDHHLPAAQRLLAIFREVHDGGVDEQAGKTVCAHAFVTTAVACAQEVGDGRRSTGHRCRLYQSVEDKASVGGKQGPHGIPQAVLCVLCKTVLEQLHRADAFAAVELARQLIQLGVAARRGGEQQGKQRK